MLGEGSRHRLCLNHNPVKAPSAAEDCLDGRRALGCLSIVSANDRMEILPDNVTTRRCACDGQYCGFAKAKLTKCLAGEAAGRCGSLQHLIFERDTFWIAFLQPCFHSVQVRRDLKM